MSAVRPGYKRTEAGVIPEEWEVTQIIAAADFLNSRRRPVKDADRAKMKGEYPYYGAAGIVDYVNDFIFDEELVLIGEDGENILSRNLPVAFRISGKAWVNNHAHVLKPKAHVDTAYFTMACAELDLAAHNSGTAQPKITKATCERLLIALPPLPEQQAIAEALGDADALIEALEVLIAKKRDLKQGAMQDLLTGHRRLPGFQGEWVETKLGGLGSFAKGSGVKKDEASSGSLPCVRYGELYTHHTDIIRRFNSHISPEVAKGALRLRAGDLLFAGSGETKEEIGKCAALVDDVEAYAGGDIIVLRPSGSSAEFLGYYLNMPDVRRQKASKGQGDAVVHISSRALASIDLKLPPPSTNNAPSPPCSRIWMPRSPRWRTSSPRRGR